MSDSSQHSITLTRDLDTTIADSEYIPVEGYLYGTLTMPSGATTQNLVFWACDTEDGTYTALYDDAGTPAAVSIASAAADRTYQLPDAIRGCRFIKIVPATGDIAGVVFTLSS